MKQSLILLLIFCFAPTTHANENLIIENVWIREAPPMIKVWAAYLILKNPTDQDFILINAKSKAFVKIMFHKTEVINGIAKMQHVDQVVIPAHSSFKFSPGGFHIMLMGRKSPLKEGDIVKISLNFKDHESQEVSAVVKKTASGNIQ